MSENLSFTTIATESRPELVIRDADLNYGRVIERVVRRHPLGISEIARKLHVSRRTLYNWFEQVKIDIDVILRIGSVIGHDFSAEFPEEFAKIERRQQAPFKSTHGIDARHNRPVYYWMHKYIRLLEKYNEILSISPLKTEID